MSMSVQDFPINFPYGATSAPYSAAHPHRGDDRACPVGTAVIIGGQTIGLTGATGNVTGAHLHLQEWKDNYANTRKPQNSFQGGTVTNIDPTGTQGDGSFGKFITIQTSDGWNDTYCHLSQINVKIGDVVGMDKVDQNASKQLQFSLLGRNGLSGRAYALDGSTGYPWVGADLNLKLIDDIFNSPEAKQYRDSQDANSIPGVNKRLAQQTGISCTQAERDYLDSLYKVVTKK